MKKIKLFAVLVMAAVVASGVFAAEKKVDSGSRVLGKTDKCPISYKVGEEITFTITPIVKNLPEGKYFVKYVLDADGNAAGKQTGKVDASKGEIILKTKMSKPGFVRVVAKLVNEKGRVVKRFKKGSKKPVDVAFNGGAGVEIEKLEGVKEPSDFDAYWASQKARLAKVPVKADMKLIKTVRGVNIYAVSVACAGPRPVTGYLTIPVNAKAGSLPASAHYQGYGTKIQKAPKSGSNDRIHFFVNAHGYDLEKDDAYYTEFLKSIRTGGKNYAMNPAENKDRDAAYFNGMVLRVMRSLEFLRSLPEWNGKELSVSGGSQGGLQSLWAAGLDDKVTACYPGIPWCCDLGGRELGRIQPTWGVPYFSPSMDYYDAAIHAKRIKCPVVITRAGIGDYTCPPSGIAVAYNNIKSPKKIYWVQGSTHGYIPDEVKRLPRGCEGEGVYVVESK